MLSGPTASAGPDQTVDANKTVTLDGSGSTDDGTISTYLWERSSGSFSGSLSTLSSTSVASPTFTSPNLDADGFVVFRLTVTDSDGLTDTDTVRINVNRALLLADSDDTGLDVELKALLEASGTTTLYADSDRGGFDTPVDGEMGLGVSETLVSRIIRSGTYIQLNDNDNPSALGLDDYFHIASVGGDLTLYVQTAADGEESVVVAGNSFDLSAQRIRITTGTDLGSLLDNFSIGDRYIFKFARAAAAAVISLAASASVPAPSAAAVVRAVQSDAVSLAASASVPAPSAAAVGTAAPTTPTTGNSVTLDLPAGQTSGDLFIRWQSTQSGLGDVSSLSSDSGDRFLTRVQLFGTDTVDIEVRCAETLPDSINTGGQDLNTDWEENAESVTLYAPVAGTITLKGPNHPDIVSGESDTTETYSWQAAASDHDALRAWMVAYVDLTNAQQGEATITLADGAGDDVVSPISLAASAAVPAPSASAVVRAIQPGPVSLAASASVPAPSASAAVVRAIQPGAVSLAACLHPLRRLLPIQPGAVSIVASAAMPAPSAAAVVRAILILSDSDDTGLDVELKALLEASDDINGTGFLYIDADRGGTDTPLDGDMSLSVSQVSRVGWTGTEIIINDNDNPQSLSLATYFNTGGSGSSI